VTSAIGVLLEEAEALYQMVRGWRVPSIVIGVADDPATNSRLTFLRAPVKFVKEIAPEGPA